jgi:hypothetical protein
MKTTPLKIQAMVFQGSSRQGTETEFRRGPEALAMPRAGAYIQYLTRSSFSMNFSRSYLFNLLDDVLYILTIIQYLVSVKNSKIQRDQLLRFENPPSIGRYSV